MAGQTITAVIAADARPFKKGMTDASKSTSVLTKSLSNVAKIGAASFAVLTAASVAFLAESVKAADQSRQISKGLAKAVENSKAFGSSASGISKVTDALSEASTQLGELAGLDDEVLTGLKRNWLAVPRIAATGVKGINKLAIVAADVAAGTGKDLEAVASAFTKAYGDPKGALAKLQKAGVVLSDIEKARYTALIKSNKQTEAMGYLVDTLGKKFQGAAKSAASPFERMKVIFGNFQEDIGAIFLPLIDEILPTLQQALEKLKTDPEFQRSLEALAASLQANIPKFVEFAPKLVSAIVGLVGALKDFLPVAQAIIDFGNTTIIPLGYNLNDTRGAAASDAANRLAARGGGLYGTQNNYVTMNSLVPTAENGRAIANAISNYSRAGGRVPR